MGEDPGDYGGFFNGGDGLQGAATIRAAFEIDVEDPLEQAPSEASAGVTLEPRVHPRALAAS